METNNRLQGGDESCCDTARYLHEKKKSAISLNVKCLDRTSRDWRTTKCDPSNDNQLWRQDQQGRIINKANGKVFMWDRYGPRFQVLYFNSGFLRLIFALRIITLDLSGASTNVYDHPKIVVKLDRSFKPNMNQKTAV